MPVDTSPAFAKHSPPPRCTGVDPSSPLLQTSALCFPGTDSGVFSTPRTTGVTPLLSLEFSAAPLGVSGVSQGSPPPPPALPQLDPLHPLASQSAPPRSGHEERLSQNAAG